MSSILWCEGPGRKEQRKGRTPYRYPAGYIKGYLAHKNQPSPRTLQ